MDYIEISLTDVQPGKVFPVQTLYKERNVTALVVKHEEDIAVYLDLCPHNKIGLSKTGNYLSDDGQRLICEAHGASFKLDDGSCDRGPCAGDTLASIPYELTDSTVRIPKQLAEQ